MSTLRRLQQLIRERSGLVLSEGSLTLENHVRERSRQLGFSNSEQFLQHIAHEQLKSDDWTQLIALATNPLTYFFRDQSQLESAVTFLSQAARENPDRKLQIWSAGCSTGEEPYTLAMLCRMYGQKSSILATDINPAVLSTARRGVYARWSLRHVEAAVAVQFFVPTEGDQFAVNDDVRAAVKFAEHNLTTSEPLWPHESPIGWDLILCRNVLIYYPLAERRAIVERLTGALRAGGVLFLGSSEFVRDYERGVRPIVIAGRQALVRVTAQELLEEPVHTPGSQAYALRPSLGSTPARPPGLPSTQPLPKLASLAHAQEQVVAEISDNRLDVAIALLREVVTCSPHDLAAHLSLGHLYVLTGELEHAERCYQVAQRLDPLLHEAHLGLGVVCLRRDDDENAFTALQRAVFLEPRFWATAYLLGEVAERLKLSQIAARERARTLRLLEAPHSKAPLVTHPLVHSGVLPRLSVVLERLHAWERDT